MHPQTELGGYPDFSTAGAGKQATSRSIADRHSTPARTTIPLARRGSLEDAWFTLSYSPVRSDDERIGGVLITVFESTDKVLAEREQHNAGSDRRRLLRELEAERAQLTEVFNRSPSFMALLRGRITWWNWPTSPTDNSSATASSSASRRNRASSSCWTASTPLVSRSMKRRNGLASAPGMQRRPRQHP